jgi:hypothetical protein
MLQLDSTFNEKAYGASSFTEFVEKLQKADFVEVTGGEGRYMIRMKGAAPEKPGAKPEEAIPLLRDVLETHRLELDEGSDAEALSEWVKQEHPNFDWSQYGFQEFSELLNYAQDKSLVRVQADGVNLTVFLGAEFHPPAPPPEPEPQPTIEEEIEEPQPLVPGQPTATGEIPIPEPPPKPVRRPRVRKAPTEGGAKKRSPRPRKKQTA